MSAYEVNFDGLIGPTHNHAGLAAGNLASARNARHESRPRQAAMHGLEKMRTLIRLGYKQGVFLPQQRPRVDVLRNLGFQGTDAQVIESVARLQPDLLPMVYSASCMWAANAATITPSMDSGDGRVHLTPANLLTVPHRAMEHSETQALLTAVFSDADKFTVHAALMPQASFADEGAANHTRLCASYDQPGVGVFVYGRNATAATRRFPARQTLRASQAIARQHQARHAHFLQQNSDAIDAGAFHNDVVAVGNGPVLFHHDQAFCVEQQAATFASIAEELPLQAISVSSQQISMDDVISSYLFNSQLLAGPDGDMTSMTLVAPTECEENPAVHRYLSELVTDLSQPIRYVHYVDVRESMSNGGGPACLRLRVVLTAEELAAVNPRFMLDDVRIDELQAWVARHYRDRLAPGDLADPALMKECYAALDELTQMFGLQQFYGFQRAT